MNYYPFHIGDFRSGTVNMTRQARWIYRDMIDVYYDTEAPLTLDFERLCDEIGVTEEAEQAIVQRVLRLKFQKTDDGYVHKVCEAVITKYRVKSEAARANGKHGGRPPKAKENPKEPSGFLSGSYPVPICNPLATGLEANQEPITKNQEPNRETPRKRSAAPPVSRPEDVAEQTWADWLELRKAKRAPVTETVIEQSRREAEKADMTLADFLRIWCARGSQGMQADWIKPNERIQPSRSIETYRERDERLARERFEEATGRRPQSAQIIDITPGTLSAPSLEYRS